MIPRTKIQKRIVGLNNQLYGCSAHGIEPLRDVKQWVENTLVEYPSCVTKSGVVTCLNCMHKFNRPKGYRKKKITCPCCGNQLGVVVCDCGGIMCSDGQTTACPWCGMEGTLGAIEAGGMSITRGKG